MSKAKDILNLLEKKGYWSPSSKGNLFYHTDLKEGDLINFKKNPEFVSDTVGSLLKEASKQLKGHAMFDSFEINGDKIKLIFFKA